MTIAARSEVVLIGHHNVGKSMIFQQLTGRQAQVANYPGTTVDLLQGPLQSSPGIDVLDTPGVVTFPGQTEDERVTCRALLRNDLRTIVQVGDAKNLRRTLLLTVQLLEMGAPFVLALNMMDEAEDRGLELDASLLINHLQVPLVPTIAVNGHGLGDLNEAIMRAQPSQFRLVYPSEVEATIEEMLPSIPSAKISKRSLALLWLSADPEVESWMEAESKPESLSTLRQSRQILCNQSAEPLSVLIQRHRLDYVEKIAANVVHENGSSPKGRLAHLTTHRFFGIPILAGVLALTYWFVGVFGAGTLVDLLEVGLFGEILNPTISRIVEDLVPWRILSDFLVGDYGIWTMGITYAFALILPIVSTFFLAFGILEDSGYLPRLAVLSNRVFSAIGLNGKAVLPMVLGLGCVTMATLTTRILESKRERVLVTLLLALAVPCSAQLGIVMGMLASISAGAVMIWTAVVFLVMLLVGWLAARLVPGERTPLMVELPPLRRPVVGNIVVKTLARVEWYIKEVVPLFLIGTVALFLLDLFSVLPRMVDVAEPLVTGWLGLPTEASAAFFMGFLRRDFGATGLFVLNAGGMLNAAQATVAMVTVTLFIPCVASVLIISRERGWKMAAAVSATVFPMAFLAGGILFRLLTWIGWNG
jgi:ferrous iron transport protein B